MTLLKNDAMRPLTNGFREAREAYEANARNVSTREHAQPEQVSDQLFKEVLDALGIKTGAELGRRLGLTERQGQEIIKNPSERLLYRHWLKLLDMLISPEEPDQDIPLARLDADEATELVRKVTLYDDQQDAAYSEALFSEVASRALLEGFSALSADSKRELLHVLRGLLLAGSRDSEDDAQSEIAQVLHDVEIAYGNFKAALPVEDYDDAVSLTWTPQILEFLLFQLVASDEAKEQYSVDSEFVPVASEEVHGQYSENGKFLDVNEDSPRPSAIDEYASRG